MYIDTTNTESGRIVLNAAHADSATVASKLDSNAGSSTLPVYFSGGVPVATGTSLAVSVTGNAATATKLKTSRTIGITDDSGEHAGTSISFNGSANKTLKLPATIGADIIGNVTGNVTGNATSADKLTVADTGSATVPTYFSGGIPTACTSLSLNTTGSAAKWTTARNITISDADVTNSGDPVALDGSAAVTLKLPATIKATLSGNASSATTAASADKLSVNAGDSNTPVYFSGGVPVACTSLDLNTTGSAAKWTTARAFKITDSDATNSGASVNVDGSAAVTLKLPSTIKASLSGKATSAGTADSADKLSVNAGSSTLPVYFSGGVPVATGESLAVNITKNAATATKLATARALAITDADGTNKGTGFDFDGSAGGTFKLPATIKANITGNISGNAASADKLTVNAGDSNTPVYFSGGVPVACTSLDLNTSGNAATATKLKTARTISISDNDGTNTATGTSFNGSANITVKLPTTIKANLTGNADTATTADKLSVNGGNAETPIYFDAGVPSSCTSIKLPKIEGTDVVVAGESTAGSFIAIQPEEIMINKVAEGAATGEQFSLTSAKLKKLNALSIASVGSTSSPVYFNQGTVTECGDSLDVDITGNAASADKLTANGGDSNTPVYFTGGIPTPCTGLDLDTSGNAATATQWKTARNFYVCDSDGTNKGVATSVNGTAAVTIKLPATIKATLSGKATSAGTADKLASDAGDSNTPVYVSGGVPTHCTALDLNTTGSAAKWTTARAFKISDADATNTSTGVNVDGSGAVTLKLPATIKATLSGNAASATTAASADKLSSNAGDSNTPVYFSGGIPTACTSLDLNTSGYAQKTYIAYSVTAAATAAKVASTTSGITFPTTITEGTRVSVWFQYANTAASPTLKVGSASAIAISPTSITWDAGQTLDFVYDGTTWTSIEAHKAAYATKANTANSATSATQAGKLTTNAGDSNTPVYFSGGIPVACTSLDLDTSGNAATATVASSCSGNAATASSVAWSGVTGKPSSFTPASHTHDYLPLTGGNLTGSLAIITSGKYLSMSPLNSSFAHFNTDADSGFWFNKSVYVQGDIYAGASYNKRVWLSGDAVTGAVWNDYAECRESDCYEAGYVLSENGDDTLSKSIERLAPFAGVSSDTWGFSQGETEKAKTHIAVAGRVLVYPYQDRNNYKPGDCVCAAPGGTVDIMTREEVREWPDRIVGTVSCVPEYEEWGGGENADRGPVKVNGRIWIKVK